MSRRNKPHAHSPIQRDSTKQTCCFCGLSEDNEVEYGKFYQHSGIVTHYYCLLLSSNMEQKGNDDEGILGFLADDMQKEIRRGRRLVCSYCRRNGATLGCCNTKCKKIFHFPCGLKAGSLHQFFGEFRSYCINHRPKQKIDERVKNEIKNMSNILCYICYEDVEPLDCNGTLWAPCCKKNAWFHRKCVQQLAMSAGYFFKCPLCNNKREFQTAMLEYGIYIPRQDASWELVPNAFEELLYRHNRCDALNCLSPKGRTYTSSNPKWELVLCRICGSQGTHLFCNNLKWANPVWECQECIAIIKPCSKSRSMSNDSTSNSNELNRHRRSTMLNVTIREFDDDSDSDISVGNDQESLDNEVNNIPTILPQLRLRPGPRSFKLQQVQKFQSSEAMKGHANSTNNDASNSNVVVNSNVLSNIGNTRTSATSTKLFGEVICLDSDDEAVEILCESAMKSTIRNNGVSSISKINRGNSNSGSNHSRLHLENDAMASSNKASTVYISAGKISSEVAPGIVEEGGDSSFNIIISNVTSVPPEFFESSEESLASGDCKQKTEQAPSVPNNLKRNHPLDEESDCPIAAEASKRARLEAAYQQLNHVESASVGEFTKDSITKIERVESLDSVLSNVIKQTHGVADTMTPLIGPSSATSSLESCHGDAGTGPAMADTSRFYGRVRAAAGRRASAQDSREPKSRTASPASVLSGGSNSELAFRTAFENGSSSRSSSGAVSSRSSKSRSSFNRSGLIPDYVYLDQLNFKTYGDNVDIIYGTHAVRLKINSLRNLNTMYVPNNVGSTSVSPFAGSNYIVSSEKSSKSFPLRSDDSDESDRNSKILNSQNPRSFVYEDDNTLLEYPTSASVSHSNIKILKRMSMPHDKTASRFAKNDLKENWDPEISSSSNNTFDNSNNNNNQVNYSDIKENNANSYEKSSKNDDSIFSQSQRDDLCANQRFLRRSNRFVRHFRSVQQSNVVKNGQMNGDSTDYNLSNSLSSSSGKSNQLGEVEQSVKSSRSLKVINSSDNNMLQDKHFKNVGVNNIRDTIAEKVNATNDNNEIAPKVDDFKVSIDLQKLSSLISAKPDLFLKTKYNSGRSLRIYRVDEKLKVEFKGETKFLTKSQSFDCLLDRSFNNLSTNKSKSLDNVSNIHSNNLMLVTDKKDCSQKRRSQRRKTRQFEKQECFR